MKTKKTGKRYPLLFYRRSMDRMWKLTLPLGVILVGMWALIEFLQIQVFHATDSHWLLVGGVVALAFSVFAILGRYMAYVQARRDHLLLVTPFLHLKISYRRIHSVHPSSFQQLFPKEEASWAQRSFLEPYYHHTAVVVDLSSYPLSPKLLKLFLPAQMFSKQTRALVLMVHDWMAFSTELDALRGSYRQGPRTGSVAAAGRR